VTDKNHKYRTDFIRVENIAITVGCQPEICLMLDLKLEEDRTRMATEITALVRREHIERFIEENKGCRPSATHIPVKIDTRPSNIFVPSRSNANVALYVVHGWEACGRYVGLGLDAIGLTPEGFSDIIAFARTTKYRRWVLVGQFDDLAERATNMGIAVKIIEPPPATATRQEIEAVVRSTTEFCLVRQAAG
jgi:hypothetical protein